MNPADTPRPDSPEEEMALILGRVEVLTGRLDVAADGLLTAADALDLLPGQTAQSCGPIFDSAYLHAARCADARPSVDQDAAIWIMENRERSEEELLAATGLNGAELLARIGPWLTS